MAEVRFMVGEEVKPRLRLARKGRTERYQLNMDTAEGLHMVMDFPSESAVITLVLALAQQVDYIIGLDWRECSYPWGPPDSADIAEF